MAQWEDGELSLIRTALKENPQLSVNQVAKILIESEYLPGRTEEAIRRRFHVESKGIRNVQPRGRKNLWSETDTERLRRLRLEHRDLSQLAFGNRFASEFDGRSAKAIEIKLSKLEHVGRFVSVVSNETPLHSEDQPSLASIPEPESDQESGREKNTPSEPIVNCEGGIYFSDDGNEALRRALVDSLPRHVLIAHAIKHLQSGLGEVLEENEFLKQRCHELEQRLDQIQVLSQTK